MDRVKNLAESLNLYKVVIVMLCKLSSFVLKKYITTYYEHKMMMVNRVSLTVVYTVVHARRFVVYDNFPQFK